MNEVIFKRVHHVSDEAINQFLAEGEIQDTESNRRQAAQILACQQLDSENLKSGMFEIIINGEPA